MLNFYIKKIEERLHKMHENHSFEEIGNKLNLSTSNVAGIVGGSRRLKNPSLDMFLKIFPKAKIDLHGDSTMVVGNDSSCIPKEKVEEKVEAAKKEAKEKFRKNAIMAVLELDNIPNDTAMEVMRVLKDL